MTDNPAINFLLIAAPVVFGVLVVYLFAIFFLSGGNLGRVRLAMRCEWRALRDPDFGRKVEQILNPPPSQPVTPPKPSGAPLRLLTLLQREGRLLDFLMEDVKDYTDEQIGAAVRDIHEKCQAALREHLVLQPVLSQPEGETVDVTSGFDPAAIRLTGNVTGQPPFRGTLRHPGWRVREIRLAPPPEGQDEFIVAPAEVELP
jgi:hypothetical protein